MSELGEITRCYSIRYHRRSKHSAARLWRAITDPEEVGRWMGCPARIELRVGGAYHVDFGSAGEEDLDGIVVRVVPERMLALVWGVSVLEWTLEPTAEGCRFQLLHHGMPRRDVPDEEGVAVGWHLWLDDFEDHLEGRPPAPAAPRERALGPRYRERLGVVLGAD